MQNPIRFLASLAALAAVAATASAQPAVKVATINLTRAYSDYWKAQEFQGKLRDEQAEIQKQISEMEGRLRAKEDELKKKQEEANSPLINKETKDRLTSELQRMLVDFRNLQGEYQQHVTNEENRLQSKQRINVDIMLDEITEKVRTIGKGRGATVIVDTSGSTQLGISSIVYADPAYDLTDAVIEELNKTKPAGFKPPAPPAQ